MFRIIDSSSKPNCSIFIHAHTHTKTKNKTKNMRMTKFYLKTLIVHIFVLDLKNCFCNSVLCRDHNLAQNFTILHSVIHNVKILSDFVNVSVQQ